ncbi:MAG TPA: glycerophosphodiester phosphodiesterase [Longimicrobiaceae bacterium]|nr:glycerophosphodiester phosphodiesterase [Longimicrobiaceae bacterium]
MSDRTDPARPDRLRSGASTLAATARRLTTRPRPGTPYLAGAPLLIAHRGGSALAPENTTTSFRQALDWWGADVLEIDVQPTCDGEVVVFHDSTLDRTTDGRGPVAAHSLAQIQALDAGYHFTPDGQSHPYRGRGVTVPTLGEVLASFPGVRVNVEIKDGRAQERVREVVDAADAAQRVLIAAGRRANRSRFGDYRGAVSASGEELRSFYIAHRLHAAALHRCDVDALQMPERHGDRQVLSPRLVRDAHAKNIAVHVWTIDDAAEMRRLLDWGVDGIVTDRPDRLAQVLHERIGRPVPPGPPAAERAPFLERLLLA